MKHTFLGVLFLLFSQILSAQQKLLQSGPLVGYSEMKEVMLWVQTKSKAKVKIAYWPTDNRNEKFFTKELITAEEDGFSVKLLANKVLPGRKYQYEVYINSKLLEFNYPLSFQSQVLYQHRFNAPDFTFAAGSCTYVNDSVYDRPGKPFGGGYEIFGSIFNKKPDFMLWLGDNLYLREPDWNTRTGFIYRYTHTRSLPELQPLIASVHNYATWDDHDYGFDNSDRSFRNKNIAQDMFNQFWCNLNTNLTGKGGITSSFQWNDAQFFLLDDRWFKSPNKRQTGSRELLGKDQVEWLLDVLSTSNATFKFICLGVPVLNPVATKENYSNYPEERDYLLKSIGAAKVPGVIFLSGDRHFTEITKMPRDSTYPFYDITVSSLLSRVYTGDEANTLREAGTRVGEKNFGLFRIEGEPANRKLIITVFNAKGEQIWTREIFAKELK